MLICIIILFILVFIALYDVINLENRAYKKIKELEDKNKDLNIKIDKISSNIK